MGNYAMFAMTFVENTDLHQYVCMFVSTCPTNVGNVAYVKFW